MKSSGSGFKDRAGPARWALQSMQAGAHRGPSPAGGDERCMLLGRASALALLTSLHHKTLAVQNISPRFECVKLIKELAPESCVHSFETSQGDCRPACILSELGETALPAFIEI